MKQLKILVADIGGTNARFGLVELGSGADYSNSQQGFKATQQITLKCASYPSIAAMAKAYCEQTGIPVPDYGCLAIAGPIENGWAKMTNLDWAFSIEEMRQELGMIALDVINDFAALAYATPFLQKSEIKLLHPGNANPTSAIVVFGPGTGFGMAALVPDNDDWKLLPTEGGHCSFAPTNEKELAIRAFLAQKQDHVSIEDILSGRGLVSIYQALAHITGMQAQDFSPADVSTKGLANEDALCREALETFCNILGSVAGDKALSLGAKGGVFLGGGIIPKIAPFIPQTDFIKRYQHKGPMAGYVGEIPVNMILNDTAALVGTAAWLLNKTPELKTAYNA
jgi:glucokinase